jgi:hypothetical protein
MAPRIMVFSYAMLLSRCGSCAKCCAIAQQAFQSSNSSPPGNCKQLWVSSGPKAAVMQYEALKATN